MKKLLLFVFISFTTLIVTAQDSTNAAAHMKRIKERETLDKKKKFVHNFMVLFGGNLSVIAGGESESGYDPVIGAVVGLQTRIIPISDNTGINFGMEYSMQGAKYEYDGYIPGGGSGSTSTTTRLNYLNFPLLVHLQKKKDGFFAEAGIQPGILLSAKSKGEETEDIKDELNTFDIGIPLGIGFQSKKKIGAVLRATPGLSNINKDSDNKNSNLVFSLRATYSF
jgi:Outer membrane protein beta-barrel domain